jgi:signal transduction histidine kinase
MCHDISNMNQVGLGFLEMSLDLLDLDEMGREMLLKPKSAFENSSKLIDNVRKLQKARSGEYPDREMDVGQVLGKVQDHYSRQYGRDVTINYLAKAGYVVKANELLYDLFSNLVENAIKHSRGHPIIDINVEPVRENGRDYYKVRIDDQGPGVPDDLKAVIFERKLTGDIKSKGSGIGLLIVKILVECYNGRAWIEDRVKGDYTKGARFIAMLPAVGK